MVGERSWEQTLQQSSEKVWEETGVSSQHNMERCCCYQDCRTIRFVELDPQHTWTITILLTWDTENSTLHLQAEWVSSGSPFKNSSLSDQYVQTSRVNVEWKWPQMLAGSNVGRMPHCLACVYLSSSPLCFSATASVGCSDSHNSKFLVRSHLGCLFFLITCLI